MTLQAELLNRSGRFTNGSYQGRKKHELDIKFPHTCFKCKKPLYWKELLIANIGPSEVYLEKLWRSNKIEFYCCLCYAEEVRK